MVEYLKVGQIINTHGINGEMKVYPLTDDIKRFNKLNFVYVKDGSDYKQINIQGIKYVKNIVVIKFEGFDSIESTRSLMDSYIFVDRDNAVKLSKDTYFIADIVGLDVYNSKDEYLGKVLSVFKTGSNDVYEIQQPDNKTFLIPAIQDVIIDIDIENHRMKINLLEGLL